MGRIITSVNDPSRSRNVAPGRIRVGAERTPGPFTTPPTDPPPPPPAGDRWFASTSPWNLLAADGTVASSSSAMVSQLYLSASGINLNLGSFTPSLWSLSRHANTTRIVKHSNHTWTHDAMPIPTSWVWRSSGERHVFIVDDVNQKAWGMLNPTLNPETDAQGTHHHCSASSAVRLNGSGFWQNNYSSGGVNGPWAERASGASCGGGLIRRSEFLSGVIPHAVACCMPFTAIGTYVAPATGTDGGNIPGNNFVPMGTRFRIKASVDIDSLGYLSPGQKLVCKAIQTYGMYVVDTSSAFAIYFQNTSEGDDYDGTNPFGNISPMSKEIVQHFEVLNPPSSVDYDNRATMGEPHQ